MIRRLFKSLAYALSGIWAAFKSEQSFRLHTIAMVIAVIIMLIFVGVISDFVTRHPSMKILALSFLLMVGVMLVAEGAGQHIDRGYVYFAMAFSLLVEVINVGNILFGSEMVGAVRGIDPQTGHHFDDTKRYIDALALPAGDKQQIFETNARRVFPRLDVILKAQGR